MENPDLEPSSENAEALLIVCTELKRALSRLSFVGMGLNDELDDQLAKLRNIIKNEGELEEIKTVIDLISKLLRTLDDDPENKEVIAANQQLDLLSQLLDNQLPNELKKDLKQVQKKLKNADAANVLRSIAEVIHCYVSQLENDMTQKKSSLSVKKKKGFFASLFSKEKSPERTEDNHSLSVNTVESNKQQSDPSSYLPQKVKDSLQLLIDQLSGMDGYSEIAQRLNHAIEKMSQIEQISSILEMITNAFIEVSDQEHIQFENFLKTLNTRIVRVNDFINQTLKFSQGGSADSKQLNLDLSNNISHIKESLTNSETLDEAKTAVFFHMDSITNQINQYCIKQESNSEILVTQMERLSEQLRATEDEATRLKDDLAEQRVRAQTDPLTNLPNRYSYNERLTQEYNRWRRYRNSLTLVIADIDFFKKVNDQHGHDFGDQILKSIAELLSTGIRESDFIARFGGEEFVILLPETGIVDATRAMNKLRQGVSKLTVNNNDEAVSVTMSFGLSEFDNHDTTKDVFVRADKALYRAKEKGRNRVCCQRVKVP